MDESLVGLAELLDQVEYSASDLIQSLGADDARLRRAVDSLAAAVRGVNALLPKSLKPPKGAFRRLQQHTHLVGLYYKRGNLVFVRSNASELPTDMVRLKAELASVLAETKPDISINVEELPAGPAKSSLREAVLNYGAGTYGSAIVSAVNALEGFLRDLRFEKLKIARERGRLVDVIEDLERAKVLTATESPLAQVLRLYRNYSAHPSGFAPTAVDARMVIQFVHGKLKSR